MKPRRSTRRQFLKQTSMAALTGATVWSGLGSPTAHGCTVPERPPVPDYGRFTDRARKVMHLAAAAAIRLHGQYLGTEHILLGLLKEGRGVGGAVLQNLGVDLRNAQYEVKKIVQTAPDVLRSSTVVMTPRAENVVAFSTQEAGILNHNYVGTEHLLLGLVREDKGVAARVLMNLGLKLEDVRIEVLNLLGHGL